MSDINDRDALARHQARMDQTIAAGTELAMLLVSFHKELKAGHLDDALVADLTQTYFDALLGNASVEDEE